MLEIEKTFLIKKIPNNFYSFIKKPLGVFLILIGLILHLIPLFPAGWIVVLGLELIGVRILLQDKIKAWMEFKNPKKISVKKLNKPHYMPKDKIK